MSVECSEFIAIAERIIAGESSEIAYRIAAGRAYYGAFHCCFDLARRHPTVVLDSKYPTHERIYRGVAALLPSALGCMDLKQIIYLAKNLREIRTDADYHLDRPFLRLRAEQAIEAAKLIHIRHQQFCATYHI